MPYQKPTVRTERAGLPGTPLGNTSFFIPTVIAKTRGSITSVSRAANNSGDEENIYVNGQMVAGGDTLEYDRVTYNSATYKTSAIPRLPLVDIFSVSTDHSNPYKREYVEGVEFSVNKTTGVMDFTDAPALFSPEIDSVTEGTGGLITAATYDIAVTARDANGNETLADTYQIVVAGGTASLVINWGKVVNASGYKVYGKTSTDSAAQYALLTPISSGTTTTYTRTAAIAADALSLPAVNSTKHTPANSDYVYVTYTYAVYNYNSPKRYYDTETVQNEHGVGSEMANAARLVIGPAGVGNASGSIYCVAPEVSNGEVLGYQNAVDACESIQELILISTTSTSDSVNQTLKAHCEDMSTLENARERFGLVSTTSTVMSDTDVSLITNKISALNGSNRIVYVITEGGTPYIDSWQNTEDKLNIITNTTDTSPYTTNVAVDGPWHAIATMGMIANLSDPAVPPTNKQVYGISSGTEGTVRLWTDTKKNTIAAAGGLILEGRYNNLFVRHALTISQASVEDSELSVMLAEAYMAKVLRDNHSRFIGKKLTDGLLNGVRKVTKDSLDGLVSDKIIRSYTTANVSQDAAKKTWINVTFSYDPIYPTNVIDFKWGFDVSGS